MVRFKLQCVVEMDGQPILEGRAVEINNFDETGREYITLHDLRLLAEKFTEEIANLISVRRAGEGKNV